MSYREDFIRVAALNRHCNPADPVSQNFARMAQLAHQATVVRMRGDQSAIFFNIPVDEQQDFLTWLRLPFKRLYIAPDGPPLIFDDYDQGIEDELETRQGITAEERERLLSIKRISAPQVRGVILAEGTLGDLQIKPQPGTVGDETWPTDIGIDLRRESHLIARVFCVTFLMPLPGFELNGHTVVLVVLTDGRIAMSLLTTQRQTRNRMRQWIIHTINFLTSPSVKLVRNEPDAALQKARRARGKPPLEGWYEITYRKHVQDYTRGKVTPGLWKHAYRYDVRGHFRRYERGPLMGRMVWVIAHQRGLRHLLYRPKGYHVEEASS